jgi:hypothetical protein
MAEVIGIVSSAITFATVVAQVTESIIAINDYCSQIKVAPHDLQILLNELELFGFILADIEEDLARDEGASALVNSKHATKSLLLCKQAAEDLEAIAKGLSRDIMSPGLLKKSYAAVRNYFSQYKLAPAVRHLYQRPYRRCKSLVAVCAECGDGNSNGQFKIVASCGEALGCCERIAKAQSVSGGERSKKDKYKIDNERCCNPDDGDNLMDHLMAL